MTTLKQIAEETGYSISLVSRVLSPKPGASQASYASPATRKIILKAKERLNYRPNRLAEFLRKGKNPIIGVFLPDTADELIAELVTGLAETAEELLFPLRLSFGMSEDRYAHFIETTRDQAHCGIITYSFFESDKIVRLIKEFHDSSGKLVLLNATTSLPGVPVVRMDEYEGGRLAARRLLDRGCRSFFCFGVHKERVRGFVETLQSEGLVATVIHDVDSGAEELAQCCMQTPALLPVGVFAVNDRLALRFMRPFRSLSLSIGQDILVIGYNDNNLVAELIPPLTTIRQSFRQLGRIAVEKIVNMIYGKEEASTSLKPLLVPRGSG